MDCDKTDPRNFTLAPDSIIVSEAGLSAIREGLESLTDRAKYYDEMPTTKSEYLAVLGAIREMITDVMRAADYPGGRQ